MNYRRFRRRKSFKKGIKRKNETFKKHIKINQKKIIPIYAFLFVC